MEAATGRLRRGDGARGPGLGVLRGHGPRVGDQMGSSKGSALRCLPPGGLWCANRADTETAMTGEWEGGELSTKFSDIILKPVGIHTLCLLPTYVYHTMYIRVSIREGEGGSFSLPWLTLPPPPLGTDIVKFCPCGESYAPPTQLRIAVLPPSKSLKKPCIWSSVVFLR